MTVKMARKFTARSLIWVRMAPVIVWLPRHCSTSPMVAPLVVWMRHDATLLMLLPAMAAKRTGNTVGAFKRNVVSARPDDAEDGSRTGVANILRHLK
jgi:hypothetical protein